MLLAILVVIPNQTGLPNPQSNTSKSIHLLHTAPASFSSGTQLEVYAAENTSSAQGQLQGITDNSNAPTTTGTESIETGTSMTGWATTTGGDVGLATASDGSGTVYAYTVDPALSSKSSNLVANSATVFSLNGAAVTPNDSYGYMAGLDQSSNNGLFSVDFASGAVKEQPVAGSSGSGLSAVAVCPDGNTVIATGIGGHLYIYTGAASNPTSLSLSSTSVSVGTNPRAVDCIGTYAYVANKGSDSISVVDLTSESVTHTISLPTGSSPDALALSNGNLYVAENGIGKLATISLANYNISQLNVGTNPDSVVVAGNVYVGNGGSSTVSVVNPSGTTLLSSVSLSASPDALAVGYAPPAPGFGVLDTLGLGSAAQACMCNASDENVGDLSAEASMGDSADTTEQVDSSIALDAMGGDPVNTATGNFTFSLPSFGVSGLGTPLSAGLTYNSALRTQLATPNVGLGWSSGPGLSLSLNSTSGVVTVNEENGSELTFDPQSSGTCPSGYQLLENVSSAYCSQDQSQALLLNTSNTWTLYRFLPTFESFSFCANSTGCSVGSRSYTNNQLESMADGDSNTTVVSYLSAGSGACPTTGLAGAVSNCVIYSLAYPSGAGRSLIFEENSASQVIAITNSQQTLVLDYCAQSSCTTTLGSLSLSSVSGDLISSSLSTTGGASNDTSTRTWDFGYDETSNLNAINQVVDPNGVNASTPYATTTNTYDDASSSDPTFGWVTKQVDGMGLSTSFNYGAYDPTTGTGPVVMTDPYGNETLYSYAGFGLAGVTQGYGSPSPSTTLYTRDSSSGAGGTGGTGLVTQTIDPNGHVSEYSVDSYGRVTGFQDPMGNTLAYTYSSSITLSNGAINPSFYLPLDVVNAASSEEIINTYYPDGNLDTVTANPSYPSAPSASTDQVTTYSYCESSTCSVGSNSYVKGELESIQDPNNSLTSTQFVTYTYDSYGDETSSTETGVSASGASQPLTTSYSYDSIGQIYCEVSPKENGLSSPPSCPSVTGAYVSGTSSYTYNALGETVTSTNPDSSTFTSGYDGNGNLTSYTDAMSTPNVTDYFYDKDNRLIQTEAGATSSSPISTYNYYDVTSNSSTYCTSFPAGATLCNATQDGNGNYTSTYYDALGRVVLYAPPTSQSTSPLESTTSYTYDSVGNVTTKVDGSGTTTYTYYANNQLDTTTYSLPATGVSQPSNTSYTYYPSGQDKSMTDGTGTTTYEYDNFGRLISVVDGAGNTVTYGYDKDSNLTCISYPNSGSSTCQSSYTPGSTTGIVTYTYDSANRMTSMQDWLSASDITKFGYDSGSNLTNVTYPASTGGSTGSPESITRSYDPNNLILTENFNYPNLGTGGTTIDNTYTQNNDGLLGSESRSTNGGTPSGGNYTYDALNQVVGAPVEGFTYDNAGNMTQHSVYFTPTYLQYNQVDEPCFSSTSSGGSCSSPPTSGTTTFGYGSAGQRCYSYVGTTSGSCANPLPGTSSTLPSQSNITTYEWDEAGNLVCETAPNTTSKTCWNQSSTYSSTYSYNADGLRMSETPAGGSLEQFTYDTVSSNPLVIEDGTNYYLYGPMGPNGLQTPIEQITVSGSAPYYIQSSITGTYIVSNASGSGGLAIEGFGTYGGCSSPYCPTTSAPIGFKSGYNDPNTTLYYFNHRYYDPSTDQFLSVDPLVSITHQPYSFANNDPVNLSDPSGDASGIGPVINGTQTGVVISVASAGIYRTAGSGAIRSFKSTRCGTIIALGAGFVAGFAAGAISNSSSGPPQG